MTCRADPHNLSGTFAGNRLVSRDAYLTRRMNTFLRSSGNQAYRSTLEAEIFIKPF